MEKIELYDSTLRDGAQAQGISFSLDDKLLLTRKLDELGVAYIEGGWPNPTNPKDLDFFKAAKRLDLTHAEVVAFGSTRRPQNKAAKDQTLGTLIKAGTRTITIFGKAWDLHVEAILRTSLKNNLELVKDSVAYLKGKRRKVVYDSEHFFDGYKANPEYAVKTLEAAVAGGADLVVLCDTNGGCLPDEVEDILDQVKPFLKVPFGIHMHNDTGCAVANTLAGIRAGSRHIQGTFEGFGERCGNANLTVLTGNLELKLGYRCLPRGAVKRLTSVSRFVSEIANIYHDHRQPYVGESAFAHKGGAHVDGVLKDTRTFEHVDPEAAGNERKFLVSDQAGGSGIFEKLQRIKPEIKQKKDPRVKKMLQKLKEREHAGYQYEAAEASFKLLAKRVLDNWKDPFELVRFRTVVLQEAGKPGDIEAILKLRVGDTFEHTVASGDGPVNALDNALRKALEKYFPVLNSVRLEDYKVRVLSSEDGTSAKVRVLIESSDGKDIWGTVGVSENIIEASWQALVDSINYKLLKEQNNLAKQIRIPGIP
jgi:2-isopropylmalate synthase